MFPASFETDRLRFERYSHGTATPRAVYEAFGRPSPTVEAETEYLPWDPIPTVGAAADRIDRFERLWDDRERAEWLLYPKDGEPIPDGDDWRDRVAAAGVDPGRAGSSPDDEGAGAGDGDPGPPIVGAAGLILEWEQDLALPAVWLRKPYWGRGYSGERADALLAVAFDRLDVGVVAVPLHADNDRSYRAVEKYVRRHGGRYEGRLRNHAGRYDRPADHHRFSIAREEYRDEG